MPSGLSSFSVLKKKFYYSFFHSWKVIPPIFEVLLYPHFTFNLLELILIFVLKLFSSFKSILMLGLSQHQPLQNFLWITTEGISAQY